MSNSIWRSVAFPITRFIQSPCLYWYDALSWPKNSVRWLVDFLHWLAIFLTLFPKFVGCNDNLIVPGGWWQLDYLSLNRQVFIPLIFPSRDVYHSPDQKDKTFCKNILMTFSLLISSSLTNLPPHTHTQIQRNALANFLY